MQFIAPLLSLIGNSLAKIDDRFSITPNFKIPQGQWRRNLSSPSRRRSQLRRNFRKTLQRFSIQSCWMFTACSRTSTPIHSSVENGTTPFDGSTHARHKSKGFLKKLPINRRVNAVQWAFSPTRTLKFLNSPGEKKKERVRSAALSRVSLARPLAPGIDISVYLVSRRVERKREYKTAPPPPLIEFHVARNATGKFSFRQVSHRLVVAVDGHGYTTSTLSCTWKL